MWHHVSAGHKRIRWTRLTMVVPTATVSSRPIKPPQTPWRIKSKAPDELICYETACAIMSNSTSKPRSESKRSVGDDVTTRCFVVDRRDCRIFHLSSDRHGAFFGAFEVLSSYGLLIGCQKHQRKQACTKMLHRQQSRHRWWCDLCDAFCLLEAVGMQDWLVIPSGLSAKKAFLLFSTVGQKGFQSACRSCH
jgi:hypothetical protein